MATVNLLNLEGATESLELIDDFCANLREDIERKSG